MRKIYYTWGMIFLMLVSSVGTAAAQSGVDASATPTPVPASLPAGSTTYQHPIVQVLSAYFGRLTRTMMPTPTPTATPTVDPAAPPAAVPPVDPAAPPAAKPTETPVMGPQEFADQIALYHQEGMGFGVLVKLYAMAQAGVEACASQAAATPVVDPAQPAAEGVKPTQPPACTAVTVEQLVLDVQGGMGMGQLFKQYGKPALLGVGQVKKAMRALPAVLPSSPTPPPTLAATPTPVPSVSQQVQNQTKSHGKVSKPARAKAPMAHGSKK